LYIAQLDGLLAFASELKAFQTLAEFPGDIDPAAMADVVRSGCIGGRPTIHRAVRRLRPRGFPAVPPTDRGPRAPPKHHWSPPHHPHARGPPPGAAPP